MTGGSVTQQTFRQASAASSQQANERRPITLAIHFATMLDYFIVGLYVTKIMPQHEGATFRELVTRHRGFRFVPNDHAGSAWEERRAPDGARAGFDDSRRVPNTIEEGG